MYFSTLTTPVPSLCLPYKVFHFHSLTCPNSSPGYPFRMTFSLVLPLISKFNGNFKLKDLEVYVVMLITNYFRLWCRLFSCFLFWVEYFLFLNQLPNTQIDLSREHNLPGLTEVTLWVIQQSDPFFPFLRVDYGFLYQTESQDQLTLSSFFQVDQKDHFDYEWDYSVDLHS